MTTTANSVQYTNESRQQLRTPTAPWTIPHAHSDLDISRDSTQTVWRRRWQSKYALLRDPRKQQVIEYVRRGIFPASAIQSVVHSTASAHARVRCELVEQRERCAHVAMDIMGQDLCNSHDRRLAIAMLKEKTGGDETGQRIKAEWDVYYDIKDDLQRIERELRKLGVSVARCEEVAEVWDACD